MISYLIIFLFFMLDYLHYYFFNGHIIYFLLDIFCIELLSCSSYPLIFLITLLIFIESWSFFGLYGLYFFYIAPLIIFTIILKKYIYPRQFQIIGFCCLSLFIQIFAIEYMFLKIYPTWEWTFIKITGNISLIYLLYLKYRSRLIQS